MNKKLAVVGFGALIYGIIVLFSQKIVFPPLSTLLLVFSLTFISYILRALRWKLLLERNGIKMSPSDYLSTFLAGLAFVITPAKLGEVAKAELMKEKYETGRKKVIFVTLVERAFDILANLIIASVSGFLLASTYLKNILLITLLFVLALILMYAFRKKLKFVEEEISSLGSVRLIIECLTLSLLAWGIEGMEVLLLVESFGGKISPVASLFAFSSSLIFGNLTMLPGGLGGAEAALVVFLALYGIEKSVAGAVTIVVRLSTLWLGFALGSIFWFLLSRR